MGNARWQRPLSVNENRLRLLKNPPSPLVPLPPGEEKAHPRWAYPDLSGLPKSDYANRLCLLNVKESYDMNLTKYINNNQVEPDTIDMTEAGASVKQGLQKLLPTDAKSFLSFIVKPYDFQLRAACTQCLAAFFLIYAASILKPVAFILIPVSWILIPATFLLIQAAFPLIRVAFILIPFA